MEDDFVLSAADNVIGSGRPDICLQSHLVIGIIIGTERFKSDEEFALAFSSKIAVLAIIQHQKVIWLIGWEANQQTKLAFYEFVSNGTLVTLLHEGRSIVLEWPARLKIVLVVAKALAYLHHNCVPTIIHWDVKANNIRQ